MKSTESLKKKGVDVKLKKKKRRKTEEDLSVYISMNFSMHRSFPGVSVFFFF